MEAEMSQMEQPGTPRQPERPGRAYEPPSMVRLGTLAELTLGGNFGLDDGVGGAGDEGSI
jgi:hypothetical protein